MRICVVGSGRVASCLIPALQDAGHDVVMQQSRAESIGVDADAYLFCIKDDAIREVVCRMHTGREDALFLHTSGSVPLSVFDEVGHKRGGVFYPMQTFSKNRQLDFARIHYFLETSQTDDYKLVEQIALSLSKGNTDNVHSMSSEHRCQLHLAAVFASNFVNHCCTLSYDILHEMGLDFDVVQPLLEEVVGKLRQMSPQEAQTGPAIRMDRQVIDKHLTMLEKKPLTQDIYRLMSQSIHVHSK